MPIVNPASFKPDNPITRFNSMVSQTTAISELVKLGCRRITMFTTPGPSRDIEREELEYIGNLFSDLDRFNLTIFEYENHIAVAERYNISYGDVAEAAYTYQQQEAGQFDGLILEWDGTNTHDKNYFDTAPSGDSTWQTALDLINERQTPVVFCYTHTPRQSPGRPRLDGKPTRAKLLSITTDNPTPYDLTKVNGRVRLPWEGFFRDELTREVGEHKLIWSSRNHHIKDYDNKLKAHGQTYRWAWLFE